MFDRASGVDAGDGTAVLLERLDAHAMRGWVGLLASADLDASQRRAQADAGIPARRQGAGVASQVALARSCRAVGPSTTGPSAVTVSSECQAPPIQD